MKNHNSATNINLVEEDIDILVEIVEEIENKTDTLLAKTTEKNDIS